MKWSTKPHRDDRAVAGVFSPGGCSIDAERKKNHDNVVDHKHSRCHPWKELCMNRPRVFPAVLTAAMMFVSGVLSAQTLGQTDDFQNGTLDSWSSGNNNPTPPVNTSTGGPAGSGDRYMHATSSGGSGAGSKLVVSNFSQWTGNYTAAGIGNIRMTLKNEGTSALQMRIALLSNSSSCASTNAISVPVGSGWINVNFPVSSSLLTLLSGSSVAAILSNVTELRMMHAASPATQGSSIAAQLGIDNITATASVTSIDASPAVSPQVISLSQNYPNPFNPSTRIPYMLSSAGAVRLAVYNLLGQQAAILVNGMQSAGAHEAAFDASAFPSGTYFYRLETAAGVLVRKLVIVK
jgi:hypothetical protein